MEDIPKHSLQADSTPAVDGKVDEKYNNVCRLAIKHLKMDGACVIWLDSEELWITQRLSSVSLLSSMSGSEFDRSSLFKSFPFVSHEPQRPQLTSQRQRILDTILTQIPADRHSVCFCAAAPVKIDGNVLGLLCVYKSSPVHRFSARDVAILEDFAGVASELTPTKVHNREDVNVLVAVMSHLQHPLKQAAEAFNSTRELIRACEAADVVHQHHLDGLYTSLETLRRSFDLLNTTLEHSLAVSILSTDMSPGHQSWRFITLDALREFLEQALFDVAALCHTRVITPKRSSCVQIRSEIPSTYVVYCCQSLVWMAMYTAFLNQRRPNNTDNDANSSCAGTSDGLIVRPSIQVRPFYFAPQQQHHSSSSRRFEGSRSSSYTSSFYGNGSSSYSNSSCSSFGSASSRKSCFESEDDLRALGLQSLDLEDSLPSSPMKQQPMNHPPPSMLNPAVVIETVSIDVSLEFVHQTTPSRRPSISGSRVSSSCCNGIYASRGMVEHPAQYSAVFMQELLLRAGGGQPPQQVQSMSHQQLQPLCSSSLSLSRLSSPSASSMTTKSSSSTSSASSTFSSSSFSSAPTAKSSYSFGASPSASLSSSSMPHQMDGSQPHVYTFSITAACEHFRGSPRSSPSNSEHGVLPPAHPHLPLHHTAYSASSYNLQAVPSAVNGISNGRTSGAGSHNNSHLKHINYNHINGHGSHSNRSSPRKTTSSVSSSFVPRPSPLHLPQNAEGIAMLIPAAASSPSSPSKSMRSHSLQTSRSIDPFRTRSNSYTYTPQSMDLPPSSPTSFSASEGMYPKTLSPNSHKNHVALHTRGSHSWHVSPASTSNAASPSTASSGSSTASGAATNSTPSLPPTSTSP